MRREQLSAAAAFGGLHLRPRLNYYGPAPRREAPRVWTGNHYTPNGLRERTRRIRQIENCQLTICNGLVLPKAVKATKARVANRKKAA